MTNNFSSRWVVVAWLWSFLTLILCGCAVGCASVAQAQVCVGGQCPLPQPVKPIERPRKPILNVVIPRNIPVDYERFEYRVKSDDKFHNIVCPIHVCYIDQLPADSQALVLKRGMPYFYYSDATQDYTVGYHDADGFLKRIRAMRPEARAAAAERERIDRERRATAAAEQARRERQAAEAQAERQRQAQEAERRRRAEESRIEEERRRREQEAEEIEQEAEPPQPPPKKRPSLRPVIREGVQVAGKATAHWAFPKIIAALGISPEVATALGIIAGSGGTAVGIYAAFLGGAALLRRLRGKKKVAR